jgi:hypothetical protein
MAQINVDASQDVLTVLYNVAALIGEIKAKQSAGTILSGELAALPALISAVLAVPNDVASDLPGVLNGVGLGVAQIISTLL